MPHDMKPQINSNLNNKGPKQKNDDGNWIFMVLTTMTPGSIVKGPLLRRGSIKRDLIRKKSWNIQHFKTPSKMSNSLKIDNWKFELNLEENWKWGINRETFLISDRISRFLNWNTIWLGDLVIRDHMQDHLSKLRKRRGD